MGTGPKLPKEAERSRAGREGYRTYEPMKESRCVQQVTVSPVLLWGIASHLSLNPAFPALHKARSEASSKLGLSKG